MDVVEVANGLSETQQRAIRMSLHDQHLMGGFYGLAYDAPDLVERVGINHPIFGSHYRLTAKGHELRVHLLANPHP